MKTYYVYMLFCRDGTFYIGVTNDLDRRLYEHRYGTDERSYTFSRRPLDLVWSTAYSDITQAIDCEKKLKGWSHRKKRLLITGDFASMTRKSPSTPPLRSPSSAR